MTATLNNKPSCVPASIDYTSSPTSLPTIHTRPSIINRPERRPPFYKQVRLLAIIKAFTYGNLARPSN